MVKKAHQGRWALWVRDLRLTWFWIFLISIAPSLLFGAAFFSGLALVLGDLVGVPSAAVSQLRARASVSRNLRRLVIMVLAPLLMLIYVFKIDEQIPKNATPITEAIESFRLETGHYPDTLEALAPKHLANIPDIRFSFSQPRINYRVTDGKPYLAIPSARGDAFAIYEYDFAAKSWRHYS